MAFVHGVATTVQVMVNDATQIGRHGRRSFGQFIEDRANRRTATQLLLALPSGPYVSLTT
jgi:hypothetical protein